MERPEFVNSEIYHIYNRGVEKRDIFLEEKDYFRFIHDLFEFNDILPAGRFSEVRLPKVKLPKIEKHRKLLSHVLAFCLMPNHYHLLLMQKEDRGITQFMRKIGTGYTNYFNKKYDRIGPLFQGRFKAKIVQKDEYLTHLVHYIHSNPIEIIAPNWKDDKIRDLTKVDNFLKKYRWSSLLDYIGIKNFPSVIQKDFIFNFFGSEDDYYKDLMSWLNNGSRTSEP